ncbi:MAG: pyruvate:ferredoxin (flavodoxin) oxidoreductase, partial [Acidobacteriota bacterium]|nr:pyruvate:ferredoxin (flavodoxin) oxidoreductase [Acidobacteriota bacterium]
ALTPDRPVLRGTAQNPDAFFQAREACNGFYLACPEIVREEMRRFAERTGRAYDLFEYVGHPNAERVIVIMGSGCEVTAETVEWMAARDERVGVVKVRLYRPFVVDDFVASLPETTRAIAVLDRTKSPGAIGEPLYLDVLGALREAEDSGFSSFRERPAVIGGRYGLSSKEFTPAMVRAVFDELDSSGRRTHFTVGIIDDVTYTSIPVDPEFDIEPDDVVRAVFYGLGADGTVSANKNSIKLIGEDTENHAQGYFVYDSKKSGAVTISHLRFGPRPIHSNYLIRKASFVACHHFVFLDRYDVLEYAEPGGVFLLNAPYPREEVWDRLPREVQEQILEKNLRLYVIDAYKVAGDAGLGGRINTVMQTCFFAISGVLPREEAIAKIKEAISATYGNKGVEVVERNYAAVDHTLAHLHRVEPPGRVTATRSRPPVVSEEAPEFVKQVSAVMIAGKGDLLPVSAFPVDGTWPVGTSKWEKRNIALEIPVWDPDICIQCNKCALICPHAAIRAKVVDPDRLSDAPETFVTTPYRGKEYPGMQYSLQVAPEDCTGCSLCVEFCPAKDKSNPRHKAIDMTPQPPLLEQERVNYAYFLDLPEANRSTVKTDNKGSQFLEPLFEYSGACSGCGETPYVKLLTQLFGDRALIANATGCSSIYGGNLPTTPFCANRDGRGPAWSNSLFEDNAEFGFGFRLAIDGHLETARALVRQLAPSLGDDLVDGLVKSRQADEAGIREHRERVEALKTLLREIPGEEARRLEIV